MISNVTMPSQNTTLALSKANTNISDASISVMMRASTTTETYSNTTISNTAVAEQQEESLVPTFFSSAEDTDPASNGGPDVQMKRALLTVQEVYRNRSLSLNGEINHWKAVAAQNERRVN